MLSYTNLKMFLIFVADLTWFHRVACVFLLYMEIVLKFIQFLCYLVAVTALLSYIVLLDRDYHLQIFD